MEGSYPGGADPAIRRMLYFIDVAIAMSRARKYSDPQSGFGDS
jgi:hypothetical protein